MPVNVFFQNRLNLTNSSVYSKQFATSVGSRDFSEVSDAALVTISALQLLLLIVVYYILVSVVLYGIGAGKFKRASELDFCGGAVYKAMLFTLVLCTLRLTWSRHGYKSVASLLSFRDFTVADTCEIHYKVISTVSCLTSFMIDVTLWFRQRILLSNASFAASFSPLFVSLSKYCIYALGLCWLTLWFLLFPKLNSAQFTSTGSSDCSIGIMTNPFGLSLLSFSIFNQFTALLLFVYPLKKFLDMRNKPRISHHCRKVSDLSSQQTSVIQATSTQITLSIDIDNQETSSSFEHNKLHPKSNNQLDNIVRTISRRTFLACIISIVPHTLVPFLQKISSDYPASVKFFIGDVAITTNVLGVLFTIANISNVVKVVPRTAYGLLQMECYVFDNVYY